MLTIEVKKYFRKLRKKYFFDKIPIGRSLSIYEKSLFFDTILLANQLLHYLKILLISREVRSPIFINSQKI